MSTNRPSIVIDDDTLSLLDEYAKEKSISRARAAGSIIKNYFTLDSHDDELLNSESELEIQRLELEIQHLNAEISELKKDKIWFQGEISHLNGAMIHQLPAPKKQFKWPWTKE